MIDTPRTRAFLLANIFQNGQADGSISAQDIRDLIVSNPEFTLGAPNPAHKEGMLFYDDVHKALSYYNEDSEVTLNIGQEMLLRVQNQSGVSLTDGDMVSITGGSGELPTVTKAISSPNTPAILGMITSSIPNTEIGYVTIFGVVHNIDTTSFSAGDTLYLSDSVNGGFTATAPILPNETFIIGSVISSAVDGHILSSPIRINFSNETTVFAQLTHTTTQTAGNTNIATPIEFNTEGFKENLIHSTSTLSAEITIAVAGVYEFEIGLQIAQTGGGNSTISVWVQHDIGGGFVDIANSAAKQDLSTNDTKVLFITHIGRHIVDDKIRFMWSTTNLFGELVAFSASAPIPAIPSVILTVAKIGTV